MANTQFQPLPLDAKVLTGDALKHAIRAQEYAVLNKMSLSQLIDELLKTSPTTEKDYDSQKAEKFHLVFEALIACTYHNRSYRTNDDIKKIALLKQKDIQQLTPAELILIVIWENTFDETYYRYIDELFEKQWCAPALYTVGELTFVRPPQNPRNRPFDNEEKTLQCFHRAAQQKLGIAALRKAGMLSLGHSKHPEEQKNILFSLEVAAEYLLEGSLRKIVLKKICRELLVTPAFFDKNKFIRYSCALEKLAPTARSKKFGIQYDASTDSVQINLKEFDKELLNEINKVLEENPSTYLAEVFTKDLDVFARIITTANGEYQKAHPNKERAHNDVIDAAFQVVLNFEKIKDPEKRLEIFENFINGLTDGNSKKSMKYFVYAGIKRYVCKERKITYYPDPDETALAFLLNEMITNTKVFVSNYLIPMRSQSFLETTPIASSQAAAVSGDAKRIYPALPNVLTTAPEVVYTPILLKSSAPDVVYAPMPVQTLLDPVNATAALTALVAVAGPVLADVKVAAQTQPETPVKSTTAIIHTLLPALSDDAVETHVDATLLEETEYTRTAMESMPKAPGGYQPLHASAPTPEPVFHDIELRPTERARLLA